MICINLSLYLYKDYIYIKLSLYFIIYMKEVNA